MEGVACFFFELKASKFASHGSGNLGLTCTYFPAWGLDSGRHVHNGLPGQAVFKNKNEVMIKKF